MLKVIVGMSGGVDSSVVAYFLKEKGYDVEGLSFILWEDRRKNDFKTCCSLQAVEEAEKTARYIGIPHHISDVKDDFVEKVIEPFMNAYASGLTPNPCILCNRFIKFPLLLKEADIRGADFIATGHYARVEPAYSSEQTGQSPKNSLTLLKKGVDVNKDQSYVLYILNQEQLKKLILPLGYYIKDDVRQIARDLKLPASKRSESQEVCFIEDRNYFKFIEKLSPLIGKPGPIIDVTGKVIGTHKGIHAYTIGQRRRLGIAQKKPLYVLKIDSLKNAVYVGPQEAAKKREFYVEDLNWIIPPDCLFSPLIRDDKWILMGKEGGFLKASVKVRSMMKDEPATIYSPLFTHYELPRSVRIVFNKPQWAPASGQSAVFYDKDCVIGGGIIKIPT
ncbi:MAG: tRNA 2-thiouridine(34) synthase MnmA [Nitrospirae bacterium]|nr:tRNA 2-thiouridine(34) synthase MnmA [Nitrospirota bacterium]